MNLFREHIFTCLQYSQPLSIGITGRTSPINCVAESSQQQLFWMPALLSRFLAFHPLSSPLLCSLLSDFFLECLLRWSFLHCCVLCTCVCECDCDFHSLDSVTYNPQPTIQLIHETTHTQHNTQQSNTSTPHNTNKNNNGLISRQHSSNRS